MNKKEAVSKFIELLDQEYPDAKCSLVTSNPLELLFIPPCFPAQCKDDRVNMVTGPLYAKYRSAEDFANADVGEILNITSGLWAFIKTKPKTLSNAVRKSSRFITARCPRRWKNC